MKLTKYVWDDAEGKLKPWPEIDSGLKAPAEASPPEPELQEFLTALQAALNQLAKANRVALSNKDFARPPDSPPHPGEGSDPGKTQGF